MRSIIGGKRDEPDYIILLVYRRIFLDRKGSAETSLRLLEVSKNRRQDTVTFLSSSNTQLFSMILCLVYQPSLS